VTCVGENGQKKKESFLLEESRTAKSRGRMNPRSRVLLDNLGRVGI